jgi:hypothetical protein
MVSSWFWIRVNRIDISMQIEDLHGKERAEYEQENQETAVCHGTM